MATGPTYFDLNDPATVQKWEQQLFIEVAKRCGFLNKKLGLIGDDESALCQRKKKVFESGGTQATITLLRQLRQVPTFGNQPLRDKEEGLRVATHKFQINQVRHAVAVQGRITQRRVTWDVWKSSLRQLGEYWPQVIESAAMMHLCGVTVDISNALEWYHVGNNLGATFSNAPTAPDTKHMYRVHGHATDDLVGLDSSAILDLDTSSILVAMAKTLPIPIRPAMVNGQELYVLFVHPYAVAHLKDNSRWLSRMRDTIKGGAIDGNPLVTGALGIDDGVLWVETPYLPCGIDASNARVANARRFAFCGAQSLVFGFAKEYENESTFTNEVESWDYANNKGVAATILAGISLPRFSVEEQGTTEDFGRIVGVSYAKELVTSA